MPVELHFDHGTLVVLGVPEGDERLARLVALDRRTGNHRAPAHRYRAIVSHLHNAHIPYVDKARTYDRLDLALSGPLDPFPHQRDALAAWRAAGGVGVVELPTGAGKTILAVLAIVHTGRPALIVVPTIDLMLQWQQVLGHWLQRPIGMLGGGSSDAREITVTTYDSAAAQTEFHGNRHGLLVCDECHHLPAPAYRFIAQGCLAPFRLGLTATFERPDGLHSVAAELLGPVCYRANIDELEGDYLAPYEVKSLAVALTEEEQARYDEARALYIDFLRGSGVSLDRPGGWAQFIAVCHRSEDGRQAFAAYREQKRIAFTAEAKIEALWRLLLRHRRDRILVFTEDNDTVHRLSRLFLLPVITHQTPPKERVSLLAQFASGALPVLLTSKVLNEGVDVPDANVGVILSGSGSVREHVQRLGRILRKKEGKRAILYELCTAVAAEHGVSERRRQHRAYQKEPLPRRGPAALRPGPLDQVPGDMSESPGSDGHVPDNMPPPEGEC
ncbi:DEAD/DEAH box helicase [Nannocystis radixulma]|uniref:DEAD/DEAH box helicase family protein n=1 Tax=Nannocystis radixulma TaxID=2995305 RepID=A0ABT5AYF8_9BACT|nr:DEAD/DEAH box helicase family protein [Nannocystis radixulma]MDC0666879.1 DEAD/DEAH box helicase family protein [Nannocystis radixulma]